ncbi:sensor histidine kinase [Deinococcus deserti]|uniref:Putative histidine kinase, classic putative membrane protein n=1 Tax=Deinococcus deserti (strain DSM 17065 / CIP 109153 / LMG 22923 / VCD115) TaxID=546414 RepID=C1CWD4_DEIDV|nr:sensor histidine kinase [Deinococcus deserti]ACO46501.1 putative histidine kinase, classic; putative membrane protein [Deinococcus deserti VCD115]
MMDGMRAGKRGGQEGLAADLLSPRTYRVALYVLLALPAGGLVAVLLTGGVVGGVLTLPLLVGAPLLLGALWLVGALADVQRVLAGLLGVSFERTHLPRAYRGVLPWLRDTLADPSTYRALLFHVVQLPLAAMCWMVLVALLAVMIAGLSAPLWVLSPGAPPVVWREWTLVPDESVVVGLILTGAGSALVLGGVLNLMGRLWTRLTLGLLAPDRRDEAARREVVALRRAAGRVALGDDLGVTLTDLATQAWTASTARSVALVAPDGTPHATSGEGHPALSGLPERTPVPGEANVQVTADGATLVTLPVTLPPSAGTLDGGTLRAVYQGGTRPGAEELAFLLSIADHAGTALHASQLIERAGARAGEQERARLARELHDSVAQALYGITLGAKTARATLDRDPGRARESLDYTIRLAEGGVSEMKALLFSLRPDALEEGGLIAALTQHAHALEARHGLRVHAELRAEPHLTPDAQAAAYRVAQEALHNVVKHARATQVWLCVHESLGVVTVSVRDDGRGFDPASQGRGTLGQRSMRERAAGAGGTLDVQSAPGEGTIVTLRIPAASAAPLQREEAHA